MVDYSKVIKPSNENGNCIYYGQKKIFCSNNKRLLTEKEYNTFIPSGSKEVLFVQIFDPDYDGYGASIK